ncbi:MAG: rhomboid family intramembrane serine protease [Flavobacteriales bacterium]|nr:rhomboid family intramembrane serine protease [Flavobacteriales bacterium]|tara:strand:+ start:5111 stop:5845 length:735 start_codon:yes stop_codon:yes gene_type:complete
MIGQRFSHLPDVVKNLMIINGLFFLADWSLQSRGIDLSSWLALHQFQSPNFMPHQLITHMFMHANFTHLFFNMFTLWMFGKTLENVWGGKRFITFYIITGLGAALIYIAYLQFQISNISSNLDSELYKIVLTDGHKVLQNFQNYTNLNMRELNLLINTRMVGASGAVYGLLLAFGMLYPNTLLYLYMAIPVKAKYFVGGLGALALISGISNNSGDNVAHFAHLGGMIFGIILLKYWKKKGDIYY